MSILFLSFPYFGHMAEDSGPPAYPLMFLMHELLSEECPCPGTQGGPGDVL